MGETQLETEFYAQHKAISGQISQKIILAEVEFEIPIAEKKR